MNHKGGRRPAHKGDTAISSQAPIDRLTWDLYSPFFKVDICAEVTFAEKGRKNSNRYPTLRAKMYTTNRYSTSQQVSKVEIATSDFIVLRHRDHEMAGASTAGKAVLSYRHLPRFIEGLAETMDMLQNDCFVQTETGFALTENGEQAETKIEDLFGGASLAFQPVILAASKEEEEDEYSDHSGDPGVRIFVNSWDHYADTPVEEFYAFLQFYQKFDLFATSRTAVGIVAQNGGLVGLSTAMAPQPERATSGLSKPQAGGSRLSQPPRKLTGVKVS